MIPSLIRLPLLSGLLLMLLSAIPAANASEPCCAIIGIHGNIVTARNNATGKSFTFTVNDKAQLARLKAGQAFTAEQRAHWSANLPHNTNNSNNPHAQATPAPTAAPAPTATPASSPTLGGGLRKKRKG